MIQDKWAEFEPFIVPEGVRQWSIPEGRRRLGETFEAVGMKELQNLQVPSVDLKAKEVLVREGDGLMGVIHVLYCQMNNQANQQDMDSQDGQKWICLQDAHNILKKKLSLPITKLTRVSLKHLLDKSGSIYSQLFLKKQKMS
jgi:hypothetical protein